MSVHNCLVSDQTILAIHSFHPDRLVFISTPRMELKKTRPPPPTLVSGSKPKYQESDMTITIDISGLYAATGTAKLADMPAYLRTATEMAGSGNDILLTGQGPIWLYLAVSHALHGKARKLSYTSPVTGEVVIYDHNPW